MSDLCWKLSQRQWSCLKDMRKIACSHTTTKHNIARTVCTIRGMYSGLHVVNPLGYKCRNIRRQFRHNNDHERLNLYVYRDIMKCYACWKGILRFSVSLWTMVIMNHGNIHKSVAITQPVGTTSLNHRKRIQFFFLKMMNIKKEYVPSDDLTPVVIMMTMFERGIQTGRVHIGGLSSIRYLCYSLAHCKRYLKYIIFSAYSCNSISIKELRFVSRWPRGWNIILHHVAYKYSHLSRWIL